MTGSMLIPNSLGEKTLLILDNSKVSAIPPESSRESNLTEARATLKREKSSPTVRQGNVKFLSEWIRVAQNSDKPPVQVPSVIIPPIVPIQNITPPSQTSIRILGEPWGKR